MRLFVVWKRLFRGNSDPISLFLLYIRKAARLLEQKMQAFGAAKAAFSRSLLHDVPKQIRPNFPFLLYIREAMHFWGQKIQLLGTTKNYIFWPLTAEYSQ